MKLLMLYKGYFPLPLFRDSYLSKAEQVFGKITFDLLQLPYEGRKKVPAKEIREWNEHNQPVMDQYDYVLIADSDWFKITTKNSKSETTLGVAQNSPNFHSTVFYCPSQAIYQIDPDKALNSFKLVLEGIKKDSSGMSTVIEPVIKSEYYPMQWNCIKGALDELLDEPILFCDIEAKSLKVTDAGIYTIGFATDKHNGIAFPVDASSEPSKVRKVLKDFFDSYKGKLVFHKANYDVPVICYNLYQQDLFDVKGQLKGLNTLCKNLDDTLIITYLATNSCSGNILGLKELAQPYAGDWAVDVKDVTKVPLEELLKYNLVDCLSTAYVYETYYPIMVQEEQETLYKEFMLPTLKTNMRCQLNGLPINHDLVLKFEEDLNQERDQLLSFLNATQEVKQAEAILADILTTKRNSKLKTKVTTIDDNRRPLNFNSVDDLEILVHTVMQLPVLDTTPTGKPVLGKDMLRTLVSHTENPTYKDILNTIADLKDVEKITSAFVPAFKEADIRLLGYLNLGGTVSGRLSSSNLNMQQLPSTGSRFAKPTKKLFTSSDEWLFCGIDYFSLEDRISALTTKDPAKLDVYLKGYDGHSLRAWYYYPELQHIDVNDVDAVNNIANTHKHLRQESKAPTFALTYSGTYLTLMKNCGFSEEKAKQIEEAYHRMYSVSDKWKEDKIKQACLDGYITTGFGLRVRTPLLKQVGYEGISKHKLASAEMRTAGNALGQGWGVLNDRAMNEVLKEIDSLGLSESVLPVCKIHDAGYYLVKNDIDTILLLNKLVVREANWNNHPDIYHPEVGLGGTLELFYPNWATPLELPEDCTEEQLIKLANNHKQSLTE